MSKSAVEDVRASSITQLGEVRTPEEQERERKGENWLWESAPHEQPQPETKEERMEIAKQLMESTESTDLNLDVGGLAKVTEDIIVERTPNGFITYIVAE